MDESVKSEQLQVRVSRQEKGAIARAAARAGMDMSSYVLCRVLPTAPARFRELTTACAGPAPRYALAELNSLLSGFTTGELREAVVMPPPSGLSPFLLNYVTAQVEQACAKRGVAMPAWTRSVAPITVPVFGSTLQSLRLHLLTNSPPPFRRRNIFIDASVGERV